MTLDGYVIRQVLTPMIGGLGVLLVLYTGYTAANLLRDTVTGAVASDQVLVFLAIRDLVALEVLLPTAGYLSMVMIAAALHREREAFAFYSAGISPNRTSLGFFVVALVIGLAVAVLSHYARPWSYKTSYELTQTGADLSVSAMEPGRYYAWRDRLVLSARGVQRKRETLTEVFARSTSGGLADLIRAATGRIDERDDSLWFLFENGTSYRLDEEGNNHVTSEFQRLYLRAPDENEDTAATKRRAKPTAVLAQSDLPKEIAEFQWRNSMPFIAFLLCLIAAVLGRTPLGRTPYLRIGLAVVIYAVVFNLAQAVKIGVENEQIPRLPGVYSVPIAIAVVFVIVSQMPRFALSRPL